MEARPNYAITDTLQHAAAHAHMLKAIALNGLTPRAVQAALGATESFIGLAVTGDLEGMCRVAGPGTIPMLTVDRMRMEAPDLIKIDVEGMEIDVLRGAKRTLAVHHPALYVEGDARELSRFLEPYGYELRGTFNETPTHLYLWAPE